MVGFIMIGSSFVSLFKSLQHQNAHNHKKSPILLGQIIGLKLVRDYLETVSNKCVDRRTEKRLGLISDNKAAMQSMIHIIGYWASKNRENGTLADNENMYNKVFNNLERVINESKKLTKQDRDEIVGLIKTEKEKHSIPQASSTGDSEHITDIYKDISIVPVVEFNSIPLISDMRINSTNQDTIDLIFNSKVKRNKNIAFQNSGLSYIECQYYFKSIASLIMERSNLYLSEGIFRKSGKSTDLTNATTSLTNNDKKYIAINGIEYETVFSLAKWLFSQGINDVDKHRIIEISNQYRIDKSLDINEIPPFLLEVCAFLSFISKHSDTNLMTAKNLSICFGPSICGDNPQSVSMVNRLIEVLIDKFNDKELEFNNSTGKIETTNEESSGGFWKIIGVTDDVDIHKNLKEAELVGVDYFKKNERFLTHMSNVLRNGKGNYVPADASLSEPKILRLNDFNVLIPSSNECPQIPLPENEKEKSKLVTAIWIYSLFMYNYSTIDKQRGHHLGTDKILYYQDLISPYIDALSALD